MFQKSQYVCLRAVDKAGNKGPPSNAAAVWLPHPPSTGGVSVLPRGKVYNGLYRGNNT